MGILWFGMGVFMMFIKYFNTGLEARFDDPVMKGFGAVCMLDSCSRLTLGYKNYDFKEQ